jgi:hypothetical protein
VHEVRDRIKAAACSILGRAQLVVPHVVRRIDECWSTATS